MHVILYLSIILFSGFILSKLASLFKLPNVTGYLIAGILVGPSIFNIVTADVASSLRVISDVALAFIAFSIGSQLDFLQLKKVGSGIMIITILEALGAVIAVDLAMIFIFKQPVPFSLILGAIAAATAPAATLMVIKQYKAEGPLVDTLLPVVALDDAVSIIVFGVSIAVARSMLISTTQVSMGQVLLTPLIEIFGSIGLGLAIGILLTYLSNKSKGEHQLLTVTIATIFLGAGLAYVLNMSPLLLCMAIGATTATFAHNKARIFTRIENFTPPIYVAFFTLAGINLHIGLLKDVGIIGLGYVLFRVVGKVLGASFGAKLARCKDTVQKYLGFALIPQAGVAIGLAMLVDSTLPQYGTMVKTIILGATVIYELIGPVITKICLVKAGEAASELK